MDVPATELEDTTDFLHSVVKEMRSSQIHPSLLFEKVFSARVIFSFFNSQYRNCHCASVPMEDINNIHIKEHVLSRFPLPSG